MIQYHNVFVSGSNLIFIFHCCIPKYQHIPHRFLGIPLDECTGCYTVPLNNSRLGLYYWFRYLEIVPVDSFTLSPPYPCHFLPPHMAHVTSLLSCTGHMYIYMRKLIYTLSLSFRPYQNPFCLSPSLTHTHTHTHVPSLIPSSVLQAGKPHPVLTI